MAIATDLDIRELLAFGLQADRLAFPSIERGGFINPGREPFLDESAPEKEQSHVQGQGSGSEEAGPAAGSRPRRRASPAAGRGSPAHALGNRLRRILKLEELLEYYPDSRTLPSSSGFALVVSRVGIFRSLPHRARLYFEVPLKGIPADGQRSRQRTDTALSTVPDVRVWAMWEEGVVAEAYHRYPDLSLCAFKPGEWQLGDPLKHYAHWCVCWLGKVIHLNLLDRWPGRQHSTAEIAVERDKPDEYCRCGRPSLWRNCHMKQDLSRTARELLVDACGGRQQYLRELEQRGWPSTPPWKRIGFRLSEARREP